MLEVASLSDVGRSRDHNEDSLIMVKQELETNGKRTEIALLAVADGMGGHAKGEVASNIAINTVSTMFVSSLSNIQNNPQPTIKNIIEMADSNIKQRAKDDPSCESMGTTIVMGLIIGRTLYLGNAGDSRCYIIREKEIRQISKDHSYVQDLIDRGEITEMEARHHPQKNVVTNVLGAVDNPKIDIFQEILEVNDVLLLTSDGLTGEVEDSEILNIIEQNPEMKKACQELIWMANQRGGRDNISVILTKVIF